MEIDSTRNVKNEDNAVSQLSPPCLRIPLILRNIMQHFSKEELLQSSLVNKQWNYEARSILRNGRGVCAHLICCKPGRDLCDLVSVLQGMKTVPFSGVGIQIGHWSCRRAHRKAIPSEALDSAFNVILDRLSFKRFSIQIYDNYSGPLKTCPAWLLAKKILGEFHEVLESLGITLQRKYTNLIHETLQHFKFPRLQTLKLRGLSDPFKEEQKVFIKALLYQAPNLQQIELDPTDFSENILEGSSAKLANFGYFDPLKVEICEGLLGAVRLHYSMELKYREDDFSMEKFNRIVPVILQTSRTTLHTLTLNLALLVNFMYYGICLENVTYMTIAMNHRQSALFQPRLLRLLKDFDFTRIFPSMTEVRFSSSNSNVSHSTMRQIIQQGNAVWKEPTLDRAAKIKHLWLYDTLTLPNLPPFLASMFPNTEKLTIDLKGGPAFSYASIWSRYSNLKELEIQMRMKYGWSHEWCEAHVRRWGENIDSLFCGIFPEEVAELREKDDEYLKTVNIVPVMPSITCLKALETFKIGDWRTAFYDGFENDPTFVFSKVTGLLAFSRSPKLSVIIETGQNSTIAWDHLKNYVSIVVIPIV